MSNEENTLQESTRSVQAMMRVRSSIKRTAQLSASGFQEIFDKVLEQQSQTTGIGSSIGFIGCRRRVGTTTVAIQAAIVAACVHGLRTVIVDANFRNPILASKFEIESPTGLSNCLMDIEETDLAVKDVGIENLNVLPNGSLKLKSRTDLGARFVELISRLTTEYQLVVVDLPEANSQVNSVFRSGMDQIYLVGNSRSLTSAQMLYVKKRLEKRNIALSGLFLNQHPA